MTQPIRSLPLKWILLLAWIALSLPIACTPSSFHAKGEQDIFETHVTPPSKPFTIHRTSQYLTMRDGIKIAVDLYLPGNLPPGQRIPTILHQTRYWRAIDYRWLIGLIKDDQPRGIMGLYATRFLKAGYAWVDVDVRGSGASFGTRPTAYSSEEIKDGAEIVDWIITQPWSNGKVGAMGISYSGGTAELLLTNKHPAVKAVAPMFSGYDLYSEIAFPGGIHLDWFTKTWTQINHRLDHNQLPFGGWMGNLFVRGVRPVDQDKAETQLAQALYEHERNWSPHHEASGIIFRDDLPPSHRVPHIDVLSTMSYAEDIEQSGAAIYSYSGWFDGGYPLAAIKRHLRHQHNPNNQLILGPWDHGGKRQISPEALGPASFDHAGELLKFFDQHLQDPSPKVNVRAPKPAGRVRYYTMGEERWKDSQQWPPASTPTPFFFQEGARLSPGQPHTTGSPDHYQVNPETGTGEHSRWNTLVGISLKHPYPDRKERDQELLAYTSDPLSQNLEVTGHPVATIYLSSTTPDTTIFVYLEDVTPDGQVHYVTEGELRALHRTIGKPEPEHMSSLPTPHHSYRQADAAPLVPGEVVPLTFDLLPTSYQFKSGHRIRVSLAGADKDHFQLLDGPPSAWDIWHTAQYPSHLDLPIVP